MPEIKPETIIIEPETGEKPVIKVKSPQIDFEQKKKIIFKRRIIWYAFTILEVILFLRFILKLFGARDESLFAIIINILSFPFVLIFNGLFEPLISPTGDIVLEWSTLFAMFFYAILAFVVSLFFRLKKPIDPQEAEKKAGNINP